MGKQQEQRARPARTKHFGRAPGASPASHFPGPLADVEDGSVSGAGGGSVACGDGARAVCVDEGVTPPSTLRNHNLAVLLTNSLGNVSVAVWLHCAARKMSNFCVHLKSVLYFCPGLTNRPVPDKNKYTFLKDGNAA